MDKEAIKTKLQKAVYALIENDSFLFDADVNERSVTHHLAIYLAKEFPDHHVDCEYNRMFRNGLQVRKVVAVEQVLTDDITAQTAYPDIIVHRRENNINNLLV